MSAEEEEFSAITDKIPQRPVSVVEGTSYTLVILAALGVRLFFVSVCLSVAFFFLDRIISNIESYVCLIQS